MKTRWKRIVSAMLTVIMLAGLGQVNVLADDTYPRLELDTPLTVAMGPDGARVTFKPETTGFYALSSGESGDNDPTLDKLCTVNGENVKLVYGDNDDWDDRDFMAVYELTGGEIYTAFLTEYYGEEISYAVTVSKYWGAISEPVSEKPSFEVSYPEEVESYQWYKVQNKPVTASDVTNIAAGVAYDSDTGVWNLSGDTWYDAFIMNTVIGAEYCVEVTDGSVRSMYLAVQDAPGDAFDSFKKEADGMYYVKACSFDSALFQVLSDSGEPISLKVYGPSGVAVAGQTTDTLTDFEPGAKYYCEVEYTNGTKLTSATFSAEYAITEEPTAAKPSVELNVSDGASYQWYIKETETSPVTDSNATPYDATGESGLIKDTASYDNATGEWSGAVYQGAEMTYEHAYFEIDLKAGDVLYIEPSETPVDVVAFQEENAEILEYVEENGKIMIPVFEDGSYLVGLITRSQDATIKAYVESAKAGEKLAGQTTNTLTQYESGVYYYCEVTYTDGTVIRSNAFTVGKTFTHQPTADETYVEVTYPGEVTSYEWYEGVEVKNYITDENAEALVFSEGTASYDESTGQWNGVKFDMGDGMYGYSYFLLQLKAGDVLTVQSSNAPTDVSNLYYYDEEKDQEYIADMKIEGDRLIFTIPEDGEYELGIAVMSDTNTIKAWTDEIEPGDKVDGQSSEKLTTAETGKSYICVVTYKDGTVITSEAFTATEATVEELEDAKKQENQEKADAVEDKIAAIPDTVTKDDEAVIKAAKEAYDALSAEEKALLDENMVKKLNAALATLEELKTADGLNGNGSNGSPETGDSSNALIWVAVLLVSSCAFGCVPYFKRRKTEIGR